MTIFVFITMIIILFDITIITDKDAAAADDRIIPFFILAAVAVGVFRLVS